MSVKRALSRIRSVAPILALCLGVLQPQSAAAADPDQLLPNQSTSPVKPVKFVWTRPTQIYSLARVMKGDLPRRQRSFGKSGLNGRLVGLLGRIERNFGRPVTITSGCRSRAANRRAGGARGSYHMRCMAADIRVAGVPEGRLLRFARNLPGVGGVGTYCGNSIVHIDVGPSRAWSGGCGRKKRRR
jgi:Peptidase M15